LKKTIIILFTLIIGITSAAKAAPNQTCMSTKQCDPGEYCRGAGSHYVGDGCDRYCFEECSSLDNFSWLGCMASCGFDKQFSECWESLDKGICVPGVKIYIDANYGGDDLGLSYGRYDKSYLVRFNDVLSSLKVPNGWTVKLYEHENFKGRVREFNSDTTYVGDDFNDITSSIEVDCSSYFKVVIYPHTNYQGWSQTLTFGRYKLSDIFIGNDTLSSLKVPVGMTVTLYTDDNFSGYPKVFISDTPYVGDDFNDKTSSIVVEGGGVIIYQHRDYQGYSQTLLPGNHKLSDILIGNDTLSSLKIPTGARVTLFEHANFWGDKKVFTSDTPYVGDDFNDKTSSIMVEYTVK
jgi:hypothetical protein